MLETLPGIVTLVMLVLENAASPMLVTLFGIVMLLIPEQPLNAPPPMLVTLLGIVMFSRFVQSINVVTPMLVTPFGIVTLVMFSLYPNARLPIVLTSLETVTLPLHFVPSISIPFTTTCGSFFCWFSSHFVPVKAPPPMLERCLG